MRVSDILRAWIKGLQRTIPALAVEITRNCPLGCSRCDGNAQVHLGHPPTSHELTDLPSLFTPQKGQQLPEALTLEERKMPTSDLLQLREHYSKLDMPKPAIRELASPPKTPAGCVLARSTNTISADLTTPILPCPFGGNPDCPSCGYFAAMEAAAYGQRIVWEKQA